MMARRGYEEAMQPAPSLTSPPDPPLTRWRRLLKQLCVLALLAALGVLGRSVHMRIEVLRKAPGVGPVDWPAVLVSPTLMRTAWVLGGDPRKAEDPATFGVEPGRLTVNIAHPLSYANGRLRMNVEIRNAGGRKVIIPPLSVNGRVTKPNGCTGVAFVLAQAAPALSRGAALVEPGSMRVLHIDIPASREPTLFYISFVLHQTHPTFIIQGQSRFQDWTLVPITRLLTCVGA